MFYIITKKIKKSTIISAYFVTTMDISEVNSEPFNVKIILVLPSPTPVTIPSLSTLAIDSSLLDHVYFATTSDLPFISGTKVYLSPILRFFSSSVISNCLTSVSITSTLIFSVLPVFLFVTWIFVLPFPVACNSPLSSTVTILSSSDDQE